MTAQPSPAPWAYEYSPYTIRLAGCDSEGTELPAYEIFDADGNKVFDTDEDTTGDRQEANARLGAAAPTLLAALKVSEGFVHWALDHGAERTATTAALDYIRAAIAEATAAGAMPEPHGSIPEREGSLDRTTPADLNAPWSLHFDRDGTEDFAVICDARGDDLLTSRTFWLPEKDDPVPPTLAFVRLAAAAPKLLAGLEAVLPYAENEWRSLDECWRRDGEAAAEKAADACAAAVERAQVALAGAKTAGLTPTTTEPDIRAILARRRQIAHIWSIADVQHLRPDLDDDQSWEVLQEVDHHIDSEYGITWLTLELAISHLFGDAPETSEAGEA